MVGHRLLTIAHTWFDEDTAAGVFEPLIADWQQECAAAVGMQHLVCRARGYACFAMSLVMSFPTQLVRRLPAVVTFSGWMATELFAAAGVLVQMYLFFNDYAMQHGAKYLIPAVLVTALPLALVPAAVVIMTRPGVRPHEARAMMVRLLLIVFIILLPLLGWITPRSNQAWRQSQVATAQRGLREVTITELLAPQLPADATVGGVSRGEELQNRMSVLLMPVTMTIVGLAVAGATRRRWVLSSLLWWLAAGFVWALLAAWTLWLSHLVLLTLAAGVRWRSWRPTNSPAFLSSV